MKSNADPGHRTPGSLPAISGEQWEAWRSQVRPYRPGDEAAILALLNEVFPGGWGSLDKWRARHTDRQGFDCRDITLAVLEGRVVACLHTAVFEAHAGGGATILLATDGDLAVHPDYRSMGIAEQLYAESERVLRARGVAVRLGFSESRKRVHYYCRALGYLTGFDATRAWNRQLDVVPLRDRLLKFFRSSPDRPDAGRGPVVEIAVTGLDPFRLRLGPKDVTLADSHRAHIRLETDQRILSLFAAGGSGRSAVMTLVRLRAIAVSGLLTSAIALWAIIQGRFLLRRD
jgi:GNAT superfamily N-acetyltransferase